MIEGLRPDIDLASLAEKIACYYHDEKAEELKRLLTGRSKHRSPFNERNWRETIFESLQTVPDVWKVKLVFNTIPRGSGGHYPAVGYDFINICVLTDDGRWKDIGTCS